MLGAGDQTARDRWLGVVAEVRGVPPAMASVGSGHGELFEAMVLLHQEDPAAAFDVLVAEGDRGVFGAVFHQWTAALIAEAAVLAAREDSAAWVDRAKVVVEGNPVAEALTRRARALAEDDPSALEDAADALDRAGCRYQAERTRLLRDRLDHR